MVDKYDIPGPDGSILGRLNSSLAAKQRVSDEQLAALVMSHQLKHLLFEAAKESLSEPLKLKLLAAVFDALEFEQQTLWNFPRDGNFHFFWDFPGCTCPKMDNRDRLGTSYAIKAGDCPIHGVTEVQQPEAPKNPSNAVDEHACSLGCVTECKAIEHGCPSECPALKVAWTML